MISCRYCDDPIGGLAYECHYCDAVFCQSHRLPEVHDCANISQARPPTSAAQEAEAFIDVSRGAKSADEIDLGELRERANHDNQPYSVVEIEDTIGTTPEPDFSSSPDVAVDGSIASEDNLDKSTANGQEELSSNRIVILVAVIMISLLLIGIVIL